MRKQRVMQTGITTDSKPVMSGAFWALETFGIPLEESMIVYQRRGWIVDVHDFIQRGLAAGWKPSTLIGTAAEALRWTYGAEAESKFKKLYESCSL